MTFVVPPSMTATQELVVPKSIPMILPMLLLQISAALRAATGFQMGFRAGDSMPGGARLDVSVDR
jgi:hypothetical protein